MYVCLAVYMYVFTSNIIFYKYACTCYTYFMLIPDKTRLDISSKWHTAIPRWWFLYCCKSLFNILYHISFILNTKTDIPASCELAGYLISKLETNNTTTMNGSYIFSFLIYILTQLTINMTSTHFCAVQVCLNASALASIAWF